MEITSFSSAAQPGGASKTGIAQQSDYATFLNMLTAQIQNQDPFNPMDASDFAVQLATFASVEQQTFTNQLLGTLLAQGGLSDLGSWVGMEARLYSGAYFSGAPIDLSPDPALGADEVILTVRDRNGAIVDTRYLAPDTTSYSWEGTDSDGHRLPDGQYSFELESRANGETLDQSLVAAYVPILEARLEGGVTLLVLPGGQLVDASSVGGLRRPQS